MTIGLDTLYRMDIWDTAWTLAPGHRLRLWLSSADTPSHEPLPEAGRNLVFHDQQHPSQLLINTGVGVSCSGGPLTCPNIASTTSGPASGQGGRCPTSSRLRFTVHQNNGRVTRVAVYVGKRRVQARHGRRIRTVSLARPRGRTFTVRIVAYTVKHKRVVSVRRYTNCTKAPPRTRVHHRRRASRRHG